jgi:general stress protein 26
MAIELNELIKEVLSVPAFGFIGTIDDSNQPVMTRIFGFKNDDPLTTLTLYTFKKDAQRVVNHLSEQSKISVTTCDATNFKTVQFKGTYKSRYDVPEEELHYVRDANAKQVEIMNMLGIPKEVFANWKYEPTLAIVMEINEIFDQTPRINTGNKIK